MFRIFHQGSRQLCLDLSIVAVAHSVHYFGYPSFAGTSYAAPNFSPSLVKPTVHRGVEGYAGSKSTPSSDPSPSLTLSSNRFNSITMSLEITAVGQSCCTLSLFSSGLFLARRSLSRPFQVLQLQYRTIAATRLAKIDRVT
jgi:hypothetical protein